MIQQSLALSKIGTSQPLDSMMTSEANKNFHGKSVSFSQLKYAAFPHTKTIYTQ